jgi:hypothetical protein
MRELEIFIATKIDEALHSVQGPIYPQRSRP